MQNSQTQRYSTGDLLVFEKVIQRKLAKAERQLATLDAQLQEAADNKSNESDWVDDSSSSANLQLLDTMANRLRKHVVDLKNAQLRIHNKSYGICSLTGNLIDRKRLMAVPTTTKSVAAKTAKNRSGQRSTIARKSSAPKVISRVIPKSAPAKAVEKKKDYLDSLAETDQLLENVEKLDLRDEMD